MICFQGHTMFCPWKLKKQLTLDKCRVSIYSQIHELYGPHQFQEIYVICSWVWNLMSIRKWKYIPIGHRWPNFNICICIQGHPWYIFELDSSITCTLKNKLILDRVTLNTISWSWVYITQTCYFFEWACPIWTSWMVKG